jgi:hypothetical protein
VGTGAIELIPRLLISVEPSGIPARALALGVVDDVGIEDAATLFEPDPHIPDIPDVSITPEGVDIPELCSIPEVADMPDVDDGSDDMPGEAAVLPADMPVAGAEAPSANPPPSEVAVNPSVPADEAPNVAQGIPLPGIAMVPVGLPGAGLVPADVISVAPSGMPVPPTDAPLVTSSGEVALTDGVGMTATCATAIWPTSSIGRTAAIDQTFTDLLPSRSHFTQR